MSYTLKLVTADDVSPEDRHAAEQRFRHALNSSLGDEALVLPVYLACQRIRATHGEMPDPDRLSEGEREILHQWLAAESAALTAALGPHRYLEDASYELGP